MSAEQEVMPTSGSARRRAKAERNRQRRYDLEAECLNCALDECDSCALYDEYGGDYFQGGCCCGRLKPTRACPHEWLDRPESDTHECLICGEERNG